MNTKSEKFQNRSEKMSKSKWNVVNPDEMINKYGADCLRLYEMFLGPLELSKPWNTNGISGTSNFIRKLWKLYHRQDANSRDLVWDLSETEASKAELKILHKTIKKIVEDIDRYSFNTSVSNFMICVNELTDLKCNKRAILEPLAIIVSPYAPHIAEELWEKLGHKDSITKASFPEFREEFMTEDAFDYPISVNGKTKFNLNIALSLSKEEIEREVMNADEVKKLLAGTTPKKVVVVPGRIVNIVV
ncbi:MAG: class I tRNA ligase family protein [Bacteroidetes bacterium]|nr:class I tRNA ligase family protein [Bacteroidota bacterium]